MQFVEEDEPVRIAEIATLMILALDETECRADFLKRISEADLVECTNTHRIEHEIGAGVDDRAWAAFEENEIDVGT